MTIPHPADLHAATADINSSSLTTFLRLNVRGVIVDKGAGFCELTGLSALDLSSARLSELIPLGRRRALNNAMEDVLQHGFSRVVRSVIVSKDRGDIPVEFSLSPVTSDYAHEGVYVLVGILGESENETVGVQLERPTFGAVLQHQRG